jgi:hypothetical protein
MLLSSILMNARLVRFASALALACLLGGSGAAVRADDLDGPKLLVTGKVTAEGELSSPDFGRFKIVPKNQGDELLKQVGEIVTVEGVVEELDDGTKLLHVDVWKSVSP